MDIQGDYKKRIIACLHENDMLYQGADGFWVFDTTDGGWTADSLRVIADHLDQLNKSWNDQIAKDLG